MNAILTRSQERKLVSYLKDIKNDEEYEMTVNDRILDLYIENGQIKTGIRDNGITVDELMKYFKYNLEDFREKCKARVEFCNFATMMVKEGFPFGALKDEDGGLKKYGFTNKREWDELTWERKKRIVCEIQAGIKYLEETDLLARAGEKFIHEYNKQLKLNFDN